MIHSTCQTRVSQGRRAAGAFRVRTSVRLIVPGLAAVLMTVPTASAQAPGGVASGLVTWQKADAPGTTAASWPDSSGNGNSATSSGSAQPSLAAGSTSRGINFNPGLDFDASNDAQAYGSALGLTGLSEFSSFDGRGRVGRHGERRLQEQHRRDRPR